MGFFISTLLRLRESLKCFRLVPYLPDLQHVSQPEPMPHREGPTQQEARANVLQIDDGLTFKTTD
jgi:hypothetical protein